MLPSSSSSSLHAALGEANGIMFSLIFAANLGLGIYSMMPTRAQRAQRHVEMEEETRYMPSSMSTKSSSSEGLFHNALRWVDKNKKMSPDPSIAPYELQQQ